MRLEWIFFMQLLMGVLMLAFLLQLMEIKKQIDKITKEVANYITYITEETEAEFVGEEQVHKWERAKENEEVQNRLIQAVLSEYFP